MYSPDKPYVVYDQEQRWKDGWDPLAYGQEFDFSRPFRVQFEELMKKVPLINLIIWWSENCDYTNFTRGNKSSYLLFASDYNENCLFSSNIFHSKSVLDTLFVSHAENSYECIDSENIYKCYFVQNCKESNNCYFCFDCVSCSYCIGCCNLRNKQYYYFNQPISKEEFERKAAAIFDYKKEIQQQFQAFKLSQPHLYANVINSENASGDYIFWAKNCQNCYDILQAEDCRNVSIGVNAKDCYGCIGVPNSKLMYESTASPENTNMICCACIWPPSDNLLYCYSSVQSHNCFGCVSAKQNEYCILNKQYTKEQYEELVPKIIEHMIKNGERWEFLPASIAPFGYNETVAMEYVSLEKEEALKKGFKWNDFEPPFPKVEKTLRADELANIREISDEILNQAIICEISGRPFKIIKWELEFYRKHNLPLPKRHPNQRHLDRMHLKNPRKLRERKCDKCWAEIKTSYSPERKEIVYCEVCYNKEVYW